MVPALRAAGKLGTDRSIRHEPGAPRRDRYRPLETDGYGLVRGGFDKVNEEF